MKTLYVIPARGGSKGIPRKNIRPLHGKPLIQYSIDVARQLAPDDDICVSTDDDEIIEVAESIGLNVPFKRPAELASDNAGMYEVLLHAVDYYAKKDNKYDCLVLLQPTSPFRKTQHVKDALDLYDESVDMVVGVSETKANPYFTLREENADGFLEKSKSQGPVATRQSAPKVYEVNGAVYVINVESLRNKHIQEFTKVKKYVMDELSSLDLDSPLDWQFCSFLIEKGLVDLDK
jgi:N-acylneuraminate cytidylyltransferase